MRTVWIEKSYLKDREDRKNGDRSIGKAIWSPRFGKDGRDSYSNMKLVKNVVIPMKKIIQLLYVLLHLQRLLILKLNHIGNILKLQRM